MRVPGTIRPLALAIIRNKNGALLVQEGHDPVKGESFYRPLGGGIEFCERGEQTLAREFSEELGEQIHVATQIGIFENIFKYHGKPEHEIILMFEANFANDEPYRQRELRIVEDGKAQARAVWRTLEQIRQEGRPLYPDGLMPRLEQWLETQKK